MAIHAAALVAVFFIRKIHWGAVALVAFAGLSVLWSADWRAGVLFWEKWLVLLMLFHAWDGGLEELGPVMLAGALAGLAAFPDVYGGFGNENFAAEFVLLCIPLAFVAMQRCWGTGYGGFALMAVAGGVFYLVALNGSRVEYLVAYVVALCWLLSRRQWFLAAIAVLVPVNVIGFWGVPDGVLGSLQARLEIWNAGLSMFLANPLGVGLGGFDHDFFLYWERLPVSHMKPVNYAGAAHNEFLDLACQLGLIGLLIAGGLVWSLYRHRVFLWVLLGVSLIGFPLQNPATALLAVLYFSQLWRTADDGTWPINITGRLRLT